LTLRLDPKVYDDAASLIETRGLAKRAYVDAQGCLCTLGAINAALGNPFTDEDSPEPGIASEAFHSWITYASHAMESVPDDYDDIPEWNDDPDRTPEEVIAFLRKLAEDLRAENESHYTTP
jgi:hypothetical protein